MAKVNKTRLAKVLRKGYDAVVLASGPNFFYITQKSIETYERPLLLLASENEEYLIAPKLDEERLKDLETTASYFYEDSEDPYQRLSEMLRNSSILKGTIKIGLDAKVSFSIYKKLSRVIPNAVFDDATEAFQTARAEKEENELAMIHRASGILDKLLDEARNVLNQGVTEAEVRFKLMQKAYELGASSVDFIAIQSGENSAIPHQEYSLRKIKLGDIIVADLVVSYNNYYADLTRVFVLGKPNNEQIEVYNIVKEAMEKGVNECTPGRPASEIDNIVRNYIEVKGYGKFFTHRTGHGLGIEVHERPYISKSSLDVLTKGNVFTVEPGIYLPGKFGVRIEVDVALWGSSKKVLGEFPIEMQQL